VIVSGCIADMSMDVEIPSPFCPVEVPESNSDVEETPRVGGVGAQGVGPTGHSESAPLKGRGNGVGTRVASRVSIGVSVGVGFAVD